MVFSQSLDLKFSCWYPWFVSAHQGAQEWVTIAFLVARTRFLFLFVPTNKMLCERSFHNKTSFWCFHLNMNFISDSCFWLIDVEAHVVLCCCGLFTWRTPIWSVQKVSPAWSFFFFLVLFQTLLNHSQSDRDSFFWTRYEHYLNLLIHPSDCTHLRPCHMVVWLDNCIQHVQVFLMKWPASIHPKG